ncbi:MAG TPA: class I SAM-dependent methyltransferase [Acidimicrobiia bacterium]|nr:class I SAM-dependent methyltransferase [Acidimicrobiia bacterium]
MDEYREANRANWDDRVAIHWQRDGYDAPGFAADRERISGVVERDRALVGDVTGKSLLHLQCHFGMDTLSWARLGAVVTGIDFSEEAIAAARRLADESGTPGRFVVTELYDTPTALAGEQFDIVYTGVGALNWLPHIDRWGEVVEAVTAPGGLVYLREAHPVLWSLEWDEEAPERLSIAYPYFETPDPVSWDDDTTYLGSGAIAHTRTYEWNHALSEVMGSLTSRGLEIDLFVEHRALEWKGHPSMTESDDGLWRFSGDRRDRVPLMYSLRARKAAR